MTETNTLTELLKTKYTKALQTPEERLGFDRHEMKVYANQIYNSRVTIELKNMIETGKEFTTEILSQHKELRTDLEAYVNSNVKHINTDYDVSHKIDHTTYFKNEDLKKLEQTRLSNGKLIVEGLHNAFMLGMTTQYLAVKSSELRETIISNEQQAIKENMTGLKAKIKRVLDSFNYWPG